MCFNHFEQFCKFYLYARVLQFVDSKYFTSVTSQQNGMFGEIFFYFILLNFVYFIQMSMMLMYFNVKKVMFIQIKFELF